MATADPNITHVGVDCTTGEVTIRPDTDADATQREADGLALVAQQQADAASEAAHQAALAAVNAKLEKIGLTPDDLLVLGKEFKTL